MPGLVYGKQTSLHLSQMPQRFCYSLPLMILCFLSCSEDFTPKSNRPSAAISLNDKKPEFEKDSWPWFLQHLQVVDSPILDYKGRPISYQEKHVGIIPFDVGNSDLQQCADALMRLRAEYLFERKKYKEIGFHFVSGQFYSWKDYQQGLRPVTRGNETKFIHAATADSSHESLRKYLDLVYTYASTISLARELKPTSGFAVGTVVIHPGSPGHCFIIIDEKTGGDGKKWFRLAEGYTPAQSIYELRNLSELEPSPWYDLKKGTIETASYRFTDYSLMKFE